MSKFTIPKLSLPSLLEVGFEMVYGLNMHLFLSNRYPSAWISVHFRFLLYDARRARCAILLGPLPC